MTYSDPYVPMARVDDIELFSQEPVCAAAKADCVVIVTDHSNVDYAALVNGAKLIVDTRNTLKQFSDAKIVRL